MDHRRTSRFILAALLALPTISHALSGTATVAGTARIVVGGCGSRHSPLSATVNVGSDGTWTSQSEFGALSGTYAPVGKSGRKIRLALDTASATLLVGEIVSEVEAACHIPPVTVKSTPVRAAVLTLSRPLTTAKLVVRWVVKGRAGKRSGTATLKLQGHGTWAPA